MERINDVCKRIAFFTLPFIKAKMFKYPKKRELCIRVEYRVRQWGIKSPNGLWKCKSFYFHY